MAAADHLLFTPQQVATSTLAALKYQSTLARIVNTDFSSQFVQGRGASITVKRPVMLDPARVYTAENRKAEDAITYSNLVEPYTSVKISDQIYQAVKLPDDFTTFTLADMENQVVAPMAETVADKLNQTVAAAFDGVAEGLTAVDKADKTKYVGENGTAYDSLTALREANTQFVGMGAKVSTKATALNAKTNADVMKAIRAARRLFTERGVPNIGRYLVVGSAWGAALLSQPNLFKVNEAGDSGLLRQATIGNLYGFTIVEDSTIDPLKAYAFQRDGITLVTRTPALPRGASFAKTVASQGFSLRYLHDYDPDHLQDRAVIDTFAGAQVLDPQRIAVLKGTDGMEEAAEPAAAAG